jgi:hypothetical protein
MEVGDGVGSWGIGIGALFSPCLHHHGCRKVVVVVAAAAVPTTTNRRECTTTIDFVVMLVHIMERRC